VYLCPFSFCRFWSKYFFGLGAGLIGMGALRIKKSKESERAIKRIHEEFQHKR